ncbi:cysteine desulfurase [Stieleria sp. ICT_E10.1]|uniref:aminotransferase class V-fold PLP-dependent enzyme n=1 Tax=Stieleria sedimenti TaxID=2976331 RepID=UPI00217FD715|nr:cysteine desulfurase [Stieleria sedimenti]MCS7466751.1 cysteine desulfurase [Stieleria sedimenti]
MIDHATIRDQFPALLREVAGRPVIYLDSAATYLKPYCVIDAVSDCYRNMAGTIGRGVHFLAEEASAKYEDARETIGSFINADADEIVFVRNATEAINLVASSLDSNTTVLGSVGEHHSNLLPWRDRLKFHGVSLTANGHLNDDEFERLLTEKRPVLTTFSTIANAYGTIHPVEALIETAHAAGSLVMLDANQSIAHQKIDVRSLNCDYLCFSGHKLGGPTGIGVLYAKGDLLRDLSPNLWGGGMVNSVSETGYELADTPMRLEAGTPAYEAAIGLAAACDYLEHLGLDAIGEHEHALTTELVNQLATIPRISVVGPKNAEGRGSIVAFHIDGLEAHSAARMLSNRANLCVRSGFHCAQLAHESQGWRPTVRASFGVYNTMADVQVLVETLRSITTNLC